MNDMYVVTKGCAWDGSQISSTLTANNAGGSQRMPDKGNFTCVLDNSQEGNESIKGDTPVAVYGLDRASFNQGKNAKYDFSIEEEKAQTLVAKGPGGVLTQSGHYAPEATKE